ncbi:MAG: hypothetical protein L0Z73_01470 [Gammaproteobacteria bacterium]|nr:hypothetical protein [Gammaproteobacteria bacterium]
MPHWSLINNMPSNVATLFKNNPQSMPEPSTAQSRFELPNKKDVTGPQEDNKISFRQLQNLLADLDEVFQETKEPDWDGDNAEPIADVTYFNATKLLAVLPADLPIPEILPDNDGYIEFEWSKGKRNFSIYITDTNLILFAGFYTKDNRLSGRFDFDGKFPSRIKLLIKEVYEAAS